MGEPLLTWSFGLDLLILAFVFAIPGLLGISYCRKKIDQKLIGNNRLSVSFEFFCSWLVATSFLPLLIGYYWFIFEDWRHLAVVVAIIIFLVILVLFTQSVKKPRAIA